MEKKNKIYLILGIILIGLLLFGNNLGLFSVGTSSGSTISGSWNNWSQIHDYSTYPNRNLATSACTTSSSTAKIKYLVPNETIIQNPIGTWNLIYSPNGNGSILLSCNNNTLLSETNILNKSVSVNIPQSCVYWDSINGNYKVELKINTDHSCIADEKVLFNECNNEEKCQGTTYFLCENKQLVNKGITNGKCGVECLSGEKCQGTTYFVCTDYEWISQGSLVGKCGYNSNNSNSTICTAGQEKCEGTVSFSCSNNAWVNQGQIDGQCGFTETESKWLSRVLFSLGNFDFKIWMLLILIGGIILLIAIK